jgi:pilus assembly protein FimV
MDQMQVAILNANPNAFHGGQVGGLMKGVTLRIPGSDEIRAVDPVAAKALVARAREGGSTVAAAPSPAPAPAPVERAAPPAEAAPPPEPAPEVAATPPPPPPEAASIPPPAEPAPSGTPPPSETAAAPPAETAATPPPAAEPTPEPKPAAKPAPKIEEGPGLVETILSGATSALENPMLKYAVGGLLALLILGFVGKKAADKFAQMRYNRASKQVEHARTGGGAAPAVGDSDVTQVAPGETPSMQAALEAAADSPTVVSAPKLAATVAMGSDTMQQTMQQTQVQESPMASTGGRAVDFDVTSNFASETVQINLDAGDPLSEAEFHRAYGLYDEAALMLKQALQKDPSRTDAKVKLAEIYFEAGKANEFVEVAKELKGQLPADKWQQIALLGSQIAPTNELFSGAGAGGVGATVDLSFDEPAAAAPAAAPSAPAAPAPAAPAGDSLEFDLGSLSLDTGAAAAPAAPPAAPAASAPGESLEFDLGSFSAEAPAAAAPAEAAPAAPAADPGASLDLGDFDLSAGGGDPTPAAGGEVVEMSAPVDDGLSAPADETGTKLDLARAYLDMGDADMAKSLLNEVAQQGNDAQKKEAEELLKRASA